MKTSFKTKFRNGLLIMLALFLGLFVFRLLTSISDTANSVVHGALQGIGQSESGITLRKNYASAKFSRKGGGGQGLEGLSSSVKVDQKYEKIATVKSSSADFEKDETVIRNKVKEYQAIIQYQQSRGNSGNRYLFLLIGVQPDDFEQFYDEIQRIGTILNKEVTQTDKTNEYRQLNAERLSLEKIRNALLELKAKGGKISEHIELENRILEIEGQLQGLGVQLGNFDEVNEFCTVKFTLQEGKKVAKTPLSQRVMKALEWTVQIYFQLVVIAAFAAFFIYLALLVLDKLQIVAKARERFTS